MIFFPGFILMIMLAMLLLSPHLQAGNGAEGLAAVFAIDLAVVSSLLWSDYGHTLSWDDENVYLRQYGGRVFMRRHPYISVPFADVREIIFHPPPRGVPPKYPLLEIDAPSHSNDAPLLIDPNYFTASSVEAFIISLCERRRELREGKQAKAIDLLLKKLGT
jgi:hypothetical protein